MKNDTNDIRVTGRLTGNPEVKTVGNDKRIAEFSIAINKSRKTASGEYEQGEPVYIDVVCWGYLADRADALEKGSQVLIEGSLQLDRWEKEGQKMSKHKIKAWKLFEIRIPGYDNKVEDSPAPADDDGMPF